MNPSEISDEVLMEQYAAGDARAFETLFRRYERRAFAYFRGRTHSADRAEDLYQELFLRVHRARSSFDASRPFAPWLFQIAHRLLIDDARRAFRQQEVPLARLDRDSRAQPRDDVEVREELSRLLSMLSERERFVVVATKGEGISYDDVAARLGKSVQAVKKMASRAAIRLRSAPAAIKGSVPNDAARCAATS